MNQSPQSNLPLCAQLVNDLISPAFSAIVKTYNSDRNSKKFNSWDHLVWLILSHIAGCRFSEYTPLQVSQTLACPAVAGNAECEIFTAPARENFHIQNPDFKISCVSAAEKNQHYPQALNTRPLLTCLSGRACSGYCSAGGQIRG